MIKSWEKNRLQILPLMLENQIKEKKVEEWYEITEEVTQEAFWSRTSCVVDGKKKGKMTQERSSFYLKITQQIVFGKVVDRSIVNHDFDFFYPC